ncbi:hypothetical protein P153DRAFT_294186 [Dothidotthia symphoricarpi CBS 119687]|uniref:BHLH domain-containing protein n=1 Tax=Dothidotthia symphoricarpi CBS 119687 TaxID=1392245 RepID=A0A6A6A8G1_9PLEO|nr:uncharacterized protein P153DRAFT_294186 [Dothidotthia symphoricarpi CBS 119687]KAF2128149.1 hypothetical protein P153DRAFT_294186 [Dothidotthia symphoricarpi CBS 119687]
MALNWDEFLDAENYNISNDQWSDLPPPQSAPPTSEMPKSISSHTSGSTPEDVTNFESLLNNTSGDPYFDDSLFIANDYFLGDLDVLQPFGNTVGGDVSATESSPEPTTGPTNFSTSHTSPSMSTHSTQMTPSQGEAIRRAKLFPNPAFESLFPNGLEAGFEGGDLAFPNGPEASSSSMRPVTDKINSSAHKSAKRTKNKPDILSACWTSPLCPNHDQDGPPPNPSSCGGGCAPFLFANHDALPSISNLLTEPQEVMADDGIVEIQPRRKKRSESVSSMNEPSGRQYPNHNTPIDVRERLKSETSEDSPIKDSPQASEDAKPKSRRRLPHNQVERKYRESLNTQLESLRRVVPSLQQGQGVCDGADIEDLPTPSKPSKAVILASATAHIKQLEKEKKQVADENLLLRTRIKALQALVKCEDCNLMQYVMNLKINQAK